MNNNVVKFPKNKIIRDVPAEFDEDIVKMKEKSKLNYADTVVNDVTDGLFEELEMCGVDTQHANFTKDFSFVVDVLRATIYRNMGLSHTLHKFIDENIKERKLEETEESVVEDDSQT